jgi:hypothetical protein
MRYIYINCTYHVPCAEYGGKRQTMGTPRHSCSRSVDFPFPQLLGIERIVTAPLEYRSPAVVPNMITVEGVRRVT